MKIANIAIYGLAESLIRAGYPMQTLINEDMQSFVEQCGITDTMLKRGIKLGNTKGGTGHDKFLRGIIVQFDIVAPRFFWQEWDTYHFQENLSSQSTMHCISKFDIAAMCDEDVDQCVIDNLNLRIKEYNESPTPQRLHKVKCNVPEGLNVGRGISSNYAQLKTQYLQRDTHRLPEWNEVFVEFCEGLPWFKQLCIGGKQ